MAKVVQELVYKLIADEKDLVQGLKDAEKQTDALAKKLTDTGKKLSLGLTAPLVAAGAASIKLAAELQDSQNAVNVIFQDGAKVIQDYGKTAAETAGLSVQSFNEVASSIGVLLAQTGDELPKVAQDTVAFTQRAADLASLLGGTTKDAANALGAALRGESEPARRFGVILSENAVKAKAAELGIAGLKDELTEAQKVQARYALIMEQSQRAQGDFANTSDGAKNSAEVLKASIANLSADLGTQLLPLVEDVLLGLRDFAKGFNELDDGAKRNILVIGGLAAALGPLLIGIGKTVTAIGTIKTALTALNASKALASFASGGPVVLGIAAVAAGITAIGVAANTAATKQENLNRALQGMANFEESKRALDDLRKQIAAMEKSSLAYGEAAIKPLRERERTLSAIVTGYQRQANEESKLAALAAQKADAEAKAAKEEADRAAKALRDAEARKAKEEELKAAREEAGKAAEEAEEAAKKAADATTLAINTEREALQGLFDSEQERYNENLKAEEEWTIKLLEQSGNRIAILEIERSNAVANATGKGQDIAAIESYYANLIATEQKKLDDEEKKRIEDTNKLREESAKAAWKAIGSAASAYFDLEQEQIEQSTDSEQDKQRKIAELKRKQAIFDKAQALVDIGINTAVAVTKALAILPPAGPILAGIIGAAGAAQAAFVLSKPLPPLPSFAQGVNNYMVPPGYPNDSFPIMVQSGERVTVETPQQQVNGQGDKTVFQIGTVIADPAGLRELDRLLKKYGTIESMRRG